MSNRKAPMTADEARENVEAMRKDTPKPAIKRLLSVAVGPIGNLSDEAKAVYREALEQVSS